MKIKLPCAIVRDLLPSYAEGLTEEETTAAVKEHLEACPDCAEKYAAMTGEDVAAADIGKEVDYLKTVRKKNRKKIVLAVVLAVVLMLGGLLAKIFVIGSPASGATVVSQAVFSPEGGLQAVEFLSTSSGEALFGWKTQLVDGVVEITARKAPVSLFHRQGDATIQLPEGDIREVRAFGRVIVQNNVVIGESAAALLDCRTPYVGDAPAMSRMNTILNGLGVQEGYTMPTGCAIELETSSRPFAMIHHYRDTLSARARQWAQISAWLSLALVDNLEEARWSWPDADGRMTITESLTLEEANANLPDLVNSYNEKSLREEIPLLDSVKDYTASAVLMQQFYLMLVQG